MADYSEPMYVVPGRTDGMVQRGNIDLAGLKPTNNVQHPDAWSTVNSLSFHDDNPKSPTYGNEVLVRGYGDDNKTTEDVGTLKRKYYRDRQHLGVFNSPDAADAYAIRLHNQWQAGQIPGVRMKDGSRATGTPGLEQLGGMPPEAGQMHPVQMHLENLFQSLLKAH